MKYPVLNDGEGVAVKPGEIVRFACCDCGLVHDVAFAYVDGEIGIALRRNIRSTAQKRRHMIRKGGETTVKIHANIEEKHEP